MSRIIRVIDNETIEISEYRNSGCIFDNNAPTIKDIRKQISNINDFCTFKETINPFVLYGKKEELQQRVDKAIEYIKSSQLYGMRSGKTLYSKVMQETINILRGKDNE